MGLTATCVGIALMRAVLPTPQSLRGTATFAFVGSGSAGYESPAAIPIQGLTGWQVGVVNATKAVPMKDIGDPCV
jgi:hypothetical protein